MAPGSPWTPVLIIRASNPSALIIRRVRLEGEGRAAPSDVPRPTERAGPSPDHRTPPCGLFTSPSRPALAPPSLSRFCSGTSTRVRPSRLRWQEVTRSRVASADVTPGSPVGGASARSVGAGASEVTRHKASRVRSALARSLRAWSVGRARASSAVAKCARSEAEVSSALAGSRGVRRAGSIGRARASSVGARCARSAVGVSSAFARSVRASSVGRARASSVGARRVRSAVGVRPALAWSVRVWSVRVWSVGARRVRSEAEVSSAFARSVRASSVGRARASSVGARRVRSAVGVRPALARSRGVRSEVEAWSGSRSLRAWSVGAWSVGAGQVFAVSAVGLECRSVFSARSGWP